MTVQSILCLTNWYVGKRIKEDVLYNKRAEYGKQVIINLAIKLSERYGSGWGTEKLRHCVRMRTLSQKKKLTTPTAIWYFDKNAIWLFFRYIL